MSKPKNPDLPGGLSTSEIHELSDADYQRWIDEDGGFFIDHHGAVTDMATGRPVATTRTQCDHLIAQLQRLRNRVDE